MLCLSLFLICGCEKQQEKTNTQNNTSIVVMPDETTKATVNGYKKPKPETDQTSEISNGYIGNKSSKKFHTSSCQYAKKIKAENKEIAKLKSDFTDKGYSPCKKCNP